MGLWLDGGLVVIAFLFLVSGLKHGAVKALAEFGGTVVAIIAASVLARTFAQPIYTNFVRGFLLNDINQALSGSNQDAGVKVDAMFQSLPHFIANSLTRYGITTDSVNSVVAGAGDQAATAILDTLSPIVIDFIRLVLLFVLFAALLFVVRLLARAVDRIFDLPVLRQLNSLLGGACGVLQCIVMVMLLCVIIKFVLPAFSQVPAVFSVETIDSTKLFKYFYYNNPIYSLLKLVTG